jgi:hypothetical protein
MVRWVSVAVIATDHTIFGPPVQAGQRAEDFRSGLQRKARELGFDLVKPEEAAAGQTPQ